MEWGNDSNLEGGGDEGVGEATKASGGYRERANWGGQRVFVGEEA